VADRNKITDAEISELKAKAERAPSMWQGEWCMTTLDWLARREFERAANPAAVLALIERLAEAESECREWRHEAATGVFGNRETMARIAALEAELVAAQAMARKTIDEEEVAVASGHERQRYLCGLADGAGGGYAPCPTREQLRADLEESIERVKSLEAWNQHAASENLAFNVRASTEISEARQQRNDALSRIAALDAALARVTAERDAAVTQRKAALALNAWTVHDGECDDYCGCDCGLDAARKAAGPGEAGDRCWLEGAEGMEAVKLKPIPIRCIRCNAINDRSATHCRSCGKKLPR
jgi:hypothetical protein